MVGESGRISGLYTQNGSVQWKRSRHVAVKLCVGRAAKLRWMEERFLEIPASSVPVGDATPTIDTPRLFQAKLAVVLPDNSITLAGGVFKFLAVHNLHCATGILDELLLLQNTSCRAHGRSIRS